MWLFGNVMQPLNIYVVLYPADSHYNQHHSSIHHAFAIMVLAQVLVWSGRVHLFPCFNGLEAWLKQEEEKWTVAQMVMSWLGGGIGQD